MKIFYTILFLFTWTSVNEASLTIHDKPKASFAKAYEMIEYYEGGYANVTSDLGEETYCGISRKFSKDWCGWHYIDEYKQNNGCCPVWNYRFDGIIEFLVTEFYVDIWIKEGFSDIEDQALTNYLFDFRIHSSIGIKVIQQQLNEYGYEFKLDNKMNPEMIRALNKINSENFLNSIRKKRIDFYKQITNRDPSQRKFLSHWIKRANV